MCSTSKLYTAKRSPWCGLSVRGLPLTIDNIINYGVRRSGSWTFQPLVDAGLDGTAKIGIAPDGVPHMALTDGDDLWYARLSDGVLETTSLATAGPVDVIADADVVVDDLGQVHLVYTNPGHPVREMFYQGAGSGLGFEPMAVETVAAGEPRIALDPSGDPHVTYRAPRGTARVRMARRCEGQWQTQTVDAVSGYADVAIADDGRIHVAYSDVGNGEIRHAVARP